MLTHLNSEPKRPVRVVVLGARGFIGRTLVAALQHAGIAVLPVSSIDIDLTIDGAAGRLGAMLQPHDAVVMLAVLTPDKGRGLQPFLTNIHNDNEEKGIAPMLRFTANPARTCWACTLRILANS